MLSREEMLKVKGNKNKGLLSRDELINMTKPKQPSFVEKDPSRIFERPPIEQPKIKGVDFTDSIAKPKQVPKPFELPRQLPQTGIFSEPKRYKVPTLRETPEYFKQKEDPRYLTRTGLKEKYPELAKEYATGEEVYEAYGKGLKPFIQRGISSATLGLSDRIPFGKEQAEEIRRFQMTQPGSTIGTIAGYISPGALGTKLVKPVIKGIGGIKGLTAGEALVGGGMEAIEGSVRGETLPEIAKRTAYGTAFGGLGGGILGKGQQLYTGAKKQIGEALESPFRGSSMADAPLTDTSERVLRSAEEIISRPDTKKSFKIKDKKVLEAQDAYNKGIEKIQNRYGTLDIQKIGEQRINQNKLLKNRRPVYFEEALDIVKRETGVDVNKLVDDLAVAEGRPLKVPTSGEQKLRRAAGQASEKQYGLLEDISLIPTTNKRKVIIPELKPSKVDMPMDNVFNKYKTKADLPRDINKLDDVIRQMEEAEKKGLKVDLQLLAEGRALRSQLSDTVASRIDFEPLKPSIKQRAKETFSKKNLDDKISKLRTQWEDRFDYLRRTEEKLTGKKYTDIPAEESLYKQARLHSGTPEKAKQVLEKELYPVLKEVDQAGYNADELTEYAAAVHAKDIHRKQKYGKEIYEQLKNVKNKTKEQTQLFEQAKEYKNYKTGFTDDQIKTSIRELKKLEPQRKKLVEYQAKRLKDLANSGRISQETYQQLRKKWKNYVPFERSFGDDKIEILKGMSEAFGTPTQPLKKFKGSERRIKNPLETIIKNTFLIEDAVSKQKVASKLRTIAGADVEGSVISKLTGKEPSSVKDRMNIVKSYEDGKVVEYSVDSEFYKAMKGLDKKKVDIGKLIQTFAGIKRAGATLTPDFAFRNPIRDFQQAYMTSPSGANIRDFMFGFLDSIPATRKILKDKSLLDDFIKNKGGYGGITSVDRNLYNEAIKKSFKNSILNKTVDGLKPTTWLRVMQDITSVTENMSKIAEYRAALRKGFSKEEAAYRARDVMDFARGGHTSKVINKFVPFFNANIQGKSKYLRALKQNPSRVIGRTITTSALPVIGLHFINKAISSDKQKQIINDAPEWMKESFFLISVPYTDEVIRIPKSFETVPLMTTLEKSLDYVFEKDKNAYDGILKQLAESQALPVLPALLGEIIEIGTNYSFFRESPIVPQREKYIESKEQKDVYTSKVAEEIGNIANVSPRKVDYFLKNTTAGVGKMSLDAVDFLTGKSQEKPAKGIKDIPVVSAFTVKEGQSESINKLYSEFENLQKKRNTAKEKSLPFKNNKEYNLLKNSTKKISTLSKKIRTIQNDKDMKPKEKRDEISELKAIRAKMAYESYKTYRDLKNK